MSDVTNGSSVVGYEDGVAENVDDICQMEQMAVSLSIMLNDFADNGDDSDNHFDTYCLMIHFFFFFFFFVGNGVY